uniref:Uncharacterized protein n=1 Tax=Haptolina brevifila TaxID=156173 RepID=A0A7S2M9Y6_9EUKA|mmetsp:Transcript_47999/g.95791  ORF Transcript_47999/g.95791 Transcript_47999/m.95791 type:complete len:126 (+) Transcript_47999:92-469(+)|eukprot:CAMPEP_0174721036 /NCGR_PEP_ID=MMETSP1094-20130205/35182_1 /TAXON_ID=156173 /ORGANISM="Chrysochromulina brevifilum, Strain UTEX LB 985" /LENGTH=125 /DNA_ID=CAMNT_0015921645 /DNA_START=91 /DNA_END=468 /DNA_ORIENTATION=-
MGPHRVLYADELKKLTVQDLKANPALVIALRELKRNLSPPTPALKPDQVTQTSSTTRLNVWHVEKSITEPPVPLLRPTSSSNRPRVVANKMHSAGSYTVASPGPGWMGPAAAMESYRRSLGPGKV